MTIPTSATGGYLAPIATFGAEDRNLNVFLQGVVVGITGMPGTNVRPRWQAEATNIPDFGVDWAAIGEVKRTRDTFAWVGPVLFDYQSIDPTVLGNTAQAVYRQEVLEILCSFYGPNSRANSELLAMGFSLPQNLEVMQQNGYGFIEVLDGATLTELVSDRFLPREDITFRVRRAQGYTYAVLIESGTVVGTLDNEKQKTNLHVP